jgi:hypothetical protein
MNSGCPTEMRKGQTNLQINVSNPSREACSVSYISRMLHVSLQSISIVQLDDDRCWIRATAAFHIRNSRIVPVHMPRPRQHSSIWWLSSHARKHVQTSIAHPNLETARRRWRRRRRSAASPMPFRWRSDPWPSRVACLKRFR